MYYLKSSKYIFIRPSTKGIAMNIKEDISLPNFFSNFLLFSAHIQLNTQLLVKLVFMNIWSIHKRRINAINTSHVGFWFFLQSRGVWVLKNDDNHDKELILILSLIYSFERFRAFFGDSFQWSAANALANSRILFFLVANNKARIEFAKY